MEKISIIVPVYNVALFLPKCLDSILNQTYKNLEVILVDDGSTDESGKICDEYAKKDNRIVVIHKENEGLGLSRNLGLTKATGNYVMFIDSDDYVADDMVKTLYDLTIKHHVDLCKCGYTKVSNNLSALSIRKYSNKLYYSNEVIQAFLPRIFGSLPEQKDSIEMCACMTLYSLNIIKKNCIRFVSERQYLSEDIFFNIDFVSHANGVYISDYVGYYYRFNEKSLSKSYRPDRFESSLFMYKKLKEKASNYASAADIRIRLNRLFFIYVRGALAQENPKISHLKPKTMKANVKKICYNKDVQEAIANYPIQKLGIKQRFFLMLVKYKKVKCIIALIKLGII